ncbi:hypothetical protein THAOC_19445, partial [Thalassiosira oceanica]
TKKATPEGRKVKLSLYLLDKATPRLLSSLEIGRLGKESSWAGLGSSGQWRTNTRRSSTIDSASLAAADSARPSKNGSPLLISAVSKYQEFRDVHKSAAVAAALTKKLCRALPFGTSETKDDEEKSEDDRQHNIRRGIRRQQAAAERRPTSPCDDGRNQHKGPRRIRQWKWPGLSPTIQACRPATPRRTLPARPSRRPSRPARRTNAPDGSIRTSRPTATRSPAATPT